MVPKSSDHIWTTKDGRRIEISQMGHVHLINAVLLLERKCSHHALPYPNFSGEMAQYAAESEFYDDLLKPNFPPQYERMLEEIERRGVRGLLELCRKKKESAE